MKQRLGTNSFSGLNVAKAPHLIEPHELTVSENGWTDQIGCWMTAKGPTRQYSGYSNITAFVAARINGEDVLGWLNTGGLGGDNYFYVNGAQIDSLGMGSNGRLYSSDDGILIFGYSESTSDKNYIYDGDVVREMGTFQATDSEYAPVAYVEDATSVAISAATKADPCVLTTAAHGLAVGLIVPVWIDNVVGMTELNTSLWQATILSGTTMSLNVDSSSFGTWSSGGDVYIRACGLTGDYRFYMTTTIELSDGRVLEGTPVGFVEKRQIAPQYLGDVFTLTPTKTWNSIFGARWSNSGINYYYNSGTLGTDYNPGIRLYRTKANGSDFYLEDSWEYGTDATLPSSFLFANSALRFYSGTKDTDLGAAYLPYSSDRSNPDRAKLLCQAGQRIFFVPSGAKNELHWTELDGIEYSNPLNYIPIPDTITAIYGYRDRVVIWSADRMWVFDLTGGLPDLNEIVTPVGTTYDQAIARTDLGVLFLRKDGLWLFDGARVQCVSRRAFASISEPKVVCAAADTIYISGESKSYVIRIRDDGWTWHEGDAQYIYADDTSGEIYATSQYVVDKLFAGDYIGGKMVTRLWGVSGEEWTANKIWVDVEGPSSFDLTVVGEKFEDINVHQEEQQIGDDGRRLVEISLNRLLNPQFYVTVNTSGNLKVHGMYPEISR